MSPLLSVHIMVTYVIHAGTDTFRRKLGILKWPFRDSRRQQKQDLVLHRRSLDPHSSCEDDGDVGPAASCSSPPPRNHSESERDPSSPDFSFFIAIAASDPAPTSPVASAAPTRRAVGWVSGAGDGDGDGDDAAGPWTDSDGRPSAEFCGDGDGDVILSDSTTDCSDFEWSPAGHCDGDGERPTYSTRPPFLGAVAGHCDGDGERARPPRQRPSGPPRHHRQPLPPSPPPPHPPPTRL